MNRVWVCCLALCFFWVVNFNGSSKPMVSFRVHIQTEGKNLSPKQAFPVRLMNPDEMIMVDSSPELSEVDLVDMQNWPSDDFGQAVRLQFTDHGAQVLSNLTLQNLGRVMVVLLNGRVIYAPVIDMELGNGILTIPRGVTEQEIVMLQNQIKLNHKK